EVEISRYNRYERQIANFYNRKQVVLLSNDNVLAKNIENLNQTLIETNKDKNTLINLQKCRYNTLLYNVIENEMKEDNNKQLFEDDKKYNLLIQTLKKPFLDSLPAEIYKDNEYDQYFINKSNKQFHSICEIENVDKFVNNIIKKNYLYKTIKEIFDQENDVITFSKIVEPNDNE
ncbi:21577_t:CDS:2, partial [Cetraspora pellucida]